MKYKFGRKPRAFDKRIRKLKSLCETLPIPPPSVNWTKGITYFGMMMNDRLGDCTCAAVYHARQIWTLNASIEKTEPDHDVLALYEKACGYNPADPSTDQGGVEQHVLSYLLNQGMPLSNGGVDRILGFVEVDHAELDEVKVTINEFGVAYIGIAVPQSIYGPYGNVNSMWDYVDPHAQILGGHAVVLVGYDFEGFTFISWGSVYKMTWAFFQSYCDEAYAIVDQTWLNSKNQTPLGLTLQQLDGLMAELKE